MSAIAAIPVALAGVGVFLQRPWGYYIVYALTFATWLTESAWIIYWPFSSWIAQELARIGIDSDLTIFVLNLLSVGALAWTHYRLQSQKLLGLPLTHRSRRRLLVACMSISGLAVVLPILGFAYALIVDPPGGFVPGAPSGGLLPGLVVVFTWPFVLAGAIGFAVAWWNLKRCSRSEAVDSNSTATVGVDSQ